ncbi:MAG TPA: hypothetical protein VIL74_00300 [Pyrinomonadaceae bacterium]|jgi:hypothetical protein
MLNECSECGAKVTAGQNECAYCGTGYDTDEQLLNELTTVARKFNEALAKGNRIGIEKHLADDFEGRLNDAGLEDVYGKKILLENARVDKNFVSYNIYNAELIDRSKENAVIHCLQTVTRRSVFEPGKFEPYIERGTIGFIRTDGSWLIASQKTETIDETGNTYQ